MEVLSPSEVRDRDVKLKWRSRTASFKTCFGEAWQGMRDWDDGDVRKKVMLATLFPSWWRVPGVLRVGRALVWLLLKGWGVDNKGESGGVSMVSDGL